MTCGLSGCIYACWSLLKRTWANAEMCRQVRCNSEDRCALCRIEVYIQAEDRTENN